MTFFDWLQDAVSEFLKILDRIATALESIAHE